MKGNLPSQISDWLHQPQIPVSRKYLDEQLQTHPDCPSLSSIADTLEELKIANCAFDANKEYPVPTTSAGTNLFRQHLIVAGERAIQLITENLNK
jgi:hypothetical protein